MVPIFLFCKERFLKSRGLEVCLALTGAGLSRSGQKQGAQTSPSGHTHRVAALSAGPAAAGCQAPGQLQASRSLTLTSGLGVQGKLSERASQENCWGDPGGAQKCAGLGRHVTDVSYRRGTRGWERRRECWVHSLLRPWATAFLFTSLSFPICKPKGLTLTCLYWEHSLLSFSQLHRMVCRSLVP